MTESDAGSSVGRVEVSVVVPLYNEKENAQPMARELLDSLDTLGKSFEVVFVDDGSDDGTGELLREIADSRPEVRVVRFRRNFGQTAAMAAGFDLVRGEVVVTMDGDRQNDPRDIPRLLAEIEKGYDLVAGWRHDRQDAFVSRRLPSLLANRLISATTKVKLHDYGCTLKAFRRDVVKNIRLYGEMHRFIPAIASWMGVRETEIPVNHRPRTAGTSKYGISRTVRVLLDLITVKFLLSYSTKPIQIFGLIGLASFGVGFLGASLLSVQRLVLRIPIGNRPILLLWILLMFIGVQFVSMGLLAEMLARTYHESQGKPIYHILEIIEGGGRKTSGRKPE